MNHYYTRLSFEKLENFDMQKSSLSSFVLVRNSLITALTKQQQQQHYQEVVNSDMMLFDKVEEQEQQVWLDSCFNELDQVYSEGDQVEVNPEDESDEEDMPLSPQDNNEPFYNKKKTTFFINEEDEEEEDGFVCYDIPFLSLVERH